MNMARHFRKTLNAPRLKERYFPNQSSSKVEDRRAKKSSSIFGILSLDGKSSGGSTRNAFARQISSKSDTQRSCVSILANVSRLKSHPHRRQRAANKGCVNPCWLRNLRTCGPTKFRGFFMFRFRNLKRKKRHHANGSEFRTNILLVKLSKAVSRNPELQCDSEVSLVNWGRKLTEPVAMHPFYYWYQRQSRNADNL